MDFFSPKRPTFLGACATWSELPSNISTMEQTERARENVENEREKEREGKQHGCLTRWFLISG